MSPTTSKVTICRIKGFHPLHLTNLPTPTPLPTTCQALGPDPVPRTLRQAMRLPDAQKWMAAHDQEIERHISTLVTRHYEHPLPTDSPIPYKFTYKIKTDREGHPSCYKARCAIRGDLMRPGTDFDDSRRAAHTPSQSAKILLYAETARSNLLLEYWDVPGAYSRASADPNYRLTMKQPILSNGTERAPDMVAVMNKAMQGAGDANILWVEHRDKRIISWGWTKLDAEPSTFYITHLDKFIRMVAETDDFLVSTNCASYLAQQCLRFESEWQITIQSPVHQHTKLRLDRTPTTLTISNPRTSWPSTTYKTVIRLPHHTWMATTYPQASPTNPYFPIYPSIKVWSAACAILRIPNTPPFLY
jgi:Reverse transcriptase (RNA-dependent DNA polymerase)